MINSSGHTCCCIPVRASVLISSLLSLISSGLGAGAFFWLVHTVDTLPTLSNDNQVKIMSSARTGLIVAGAVLAVVVVISLFGFLGSAIRNRRIVKAYSILVWIGLFSFLTLTAFAFHLVFSNGTLIECYDGDNGVPCSPILTVGAKVGFIINNIIGLLFHLDVCVVIERYVEQLEDEWAYRNGFGFDKKNTAYYPFHNIERNLGWLEHNSKPFLCRRVYLFPHCQTYPLLWFPLPNFVFAFFSYQ